MVTNQPQTASQITDRNFDFVIDSLDKPTFVFFWAPWSKACQQYAELLPEIEEALAERCSFFWMNIDENANIPASLGVTRIPQIISFIDGQNATYLEGRHSKVAIKEFIYRIVENGS